MAAVVLHKQVNLASDKMQMRRRLDLLRGPFRLGLARQEIRPPVTLPSGILGELHLVDEYLARGSCFSMPEP